MENERTYSRRDFLERAALFVGGTAAAGAAATGAAAGVAYADERIGNWAADGSHEVELPASEATNASAFDGTYRDHNPEAFPANDASPIPPRAVPEAWDYECDICVVGAGGGGLNAAARSAELGAHTICVEALGLHGGNAQEAGMCGILAACPCRRTRSSPSPAIPLAPRPLPIGPWTSTTTRPTPS